MNPNQITAILCKYDRIKGTTRYLSICVNDKGNVLYSHEYQSLNVFKIIWSFIATNNPSVYVYGPDNDIIDTFIAALKVVDITATNGGILTLSYSTS